MKRAITDSEFSLSAEEFMWSQEGLSEVHTLVLPVIRQWLRDSHVQRVLDLGCGNGALTNELYKSGFEVTGMDPSSSGIVIARKSYPALNFLHAGMERRLPDELLDRFDAVLAVEVVEHLLLPRQLFQRAREALRNGGMLLVTTPYHGFLKNLALALCNRFDEHWHPLRDYGHVKFFSRKTMTHLFAEQGFTVRRFERVGRCAALAKSMLVLGEKQPRL